MDGLRQIQGVRRRTSQPLRPEVVQQLDLFLGITATHRAPRTTQILHSGMGTQASGKHSVAVGYLHGVVLCQTVGGQVASHDFGPDTQVLTGISHDDRLTCRTGRGMQTDNLGHRHGLQAERIIITQVLFYRER